jgi:cell division septation protein DedD
MKAEEKWPEFMRGDTEPEPAGEAEQDELHLDLDSLTVDDLSPPPAGRRRRPQSLKKRDAGARKSRRLLPALMIILLLALLGAGGALGYFWFFGGKPKSAPLVQALDDPVKVKPESPGGLEVPYQDQLVLNKPAGEAADEPVVERLLPPPETPKPPVRESAAEPSAEPPPQPVEPAVIEAPVPPKSAVVEAPPATMKPVGKKVQTAAKGSYLLQLGSFTSTGAAEGAWGKLQKSFPNLLDDMSLFVQQAKVNDKTYFRVRAGPFPNRATALDLCAQLKAKKQDCLVVRAN